MPTSGGMSYDVSRSFVDFRLSGMPRFRFGSNQSSFLSLLVSHLRPSSSVVPFSLEALDATTRLRSGISIRELGRELGDDFDRWQRQIFGFSSVDVQQLTVAKNFYIIFQRWGCCKFERESEAVKFWTWFKLYGTAVWESFEFSKIWKESLRSHISSCSQFYARFVQFLVNAI